MASSSERKALLFFALVATLGAGVRLWRARAADTLKPTADSLAEQDERVTSSSSSLDHARKPKGKRRASSHAGPDSHYGAPGTARRQTSRNRPVVRDSDATVDLDRASLSQIDALGVLKPGVARLIVADRDSFGPFGSIQELKRVPFLSSADIRTLAPRVTFSRLPRPKNTVIQPRSPDADVAESRRAHRGKRHSQ